jgi:hypothetical protein
MMRKIKRDKWERLEGAPDFSDKAIIAGIPMQSSPVQALALDHGFIYIREWSGGAWLRTHPDYATTE